MSRFKRFGLQLVGFIALIVVFRLWQGQGLPDGPAPAFQGRLISGETVALDRFRGAPLLVHFWATWCPVCDYMQENVDALARDYPVVTVALEDTAAEEEVRAYLEARGVSYPVMLDRDGHLALRYGVRVVPASFFLDAGGEIRTAETGYTTALGLRLRMWWASL